MTSISDASGGGRGFPTAPTILSEQEQQAVWFLGALVRVRTHGSTTGGALAVLEHSGERGYSSPLHRHRDDEETFIVLDGELRVEVDGVTQSAGAGAAAMLPRGLAHSFVVTSKEARFLTIHTPAGFEAFAVRAGEPAASFDAPHGCAPARPGAARCDGRRLRHRNPGSTADAMSRACVADGRRKASPPTRSPTLGQAELAC